MAKEKDAVNLVGNGAEHDGVGRRKRKRKIIIVYYIIKLNNKKIFSF